MSGALAQRIGEQMDRAVQPQVAAFARRLAEAAGAEAALFYGSNLRTGELDGVLDFYLLLPGSQRETIWPRVSYHEWEHAGLILRAKVATMALETFARACRGDSRDTTIWARFVQPAALVHVSAPGTREAVRDALAQAAITATRYAAALGPASGTEDDYWRALFRETYRAEFRVERPGRENSILGLNPQHFDGLLPAAWTAAGIPFEMQEHGRLAVALSPEQRAGLVQAWRARRRWGKPLNVLRLLKASTTFEGAARYAAWKIERHTGVAVEVTPWRERHPVLAAPGVLWKLWRARRK